MYICVQVGRNELFRRYCIFFIYLNFESVFYRVEIWLNWMRSRLTGFRLKILRRNVNQIVWIMNLFESWIRYLFLCYRFQFQWDRTAGWWQDDYIMVREQSSLRIARISVIFFKVSRANGTKSITNMRTTDYSMTMTRIRKKEGKEINGKQVEEDVELRLKRWIVDY